MAVLMHADIKLDRAFECSRRYLPLDYRARQGKKPRCPSKTQWPIQCPYVPEEMSSRFRPVAGPALALVSMKLVKDWQAECAKFFDTVDPKLNLKVYIEHRSAILDERIGMLEKKKIITLRGTQPTTDTPRYLIITLPTSYKNNILYYLSTHESGLITAPGKKKQKFRSKLTAQDVWGQIFQDEYYEEKRREIKGMSLCWGARAAYSEAKIWFVSGTPWSTSPRDLDRVFAVFYVKNEWDKRPRLRKAEPQEYIKLISRYEAILNKKSDAVSKISNMEPVKSMAELLEIVMIRRTSESRWFGKRIVELSPYTWTEITVQFPIDYKPALQKMENLLKLSLKTTMSIPGIPPKKLTLTRFFERAYKIRVMTVFPALATLVLKHPSLDLTWANC